MNVDWKKVHHIHFVGMKGVAMAALAIYFRERGVKVTGCDVAEEFPTDEELKSAGIHPEVGFEPRLAGRRKPDMVIYTGAHNGRENPVVKAAVRLKIPAFPHGQALGMVMEGSRQIVTAGSHGKTTVTAMIATVLAASGRDPSYAVGCGGISGLGAAGHFGKSDWFVAEGDEYVTDPGHNLTPRFLWMKPEILVVTNIDFDHPDAYPNLAAVQDAFKRLLDQQTDGGLTVVNIDDPASGVLLRGKNVVTYGFSPRADVRITHVGVGAQRMFFTLEQKGVLLGEFVLRVPGRHNALNATAAFVASQAAGAGVNEIREGLQKFLGTKRRFEKLAEKNGVTYYDDYAHHPHEIEATLAAAKQWFRDKRIIAVFQPHTYSRTRALLSEFAQAFTSAHEVILTDIYASAREHETLGISGKTLVMETAKHQPHVFYAPDAGAVSTLLSQRTRAGDVVIFMGAGDIYTWEKQIV